MQNPEARETLLDETAPAVISMFKENLNALETVDAASVQPIFKAITKGLKVKGQKSVYAIARSDNRADAWTGFGTHH